MVTTGMRDGKASIAVTTWGEAGTVRIIPSAQLPARAIRAARPGFRQRIAFVLVAIGVGIAVVDTIYTTPYSATAAHSNLVEVYR